MQCTGWTGAGTFGGGGGLGLAGQHTHSLAAASFSRISGSWFLLNTRASIAHRLSSYSTQTHATLRQQCQHLAATVPKRLNAASASRSEWYVLPALVVLIDRLQPTVGKMDSYKDAYDALKRCIEMNDGQWVQQHVSVPVERVH